MRLLSFGLAALLVCFVVQPSAGKVVHRWSFTKDGSDSVGKANATLKDAKVSDGKVTLDGENGSVDLPIGSTLSKLKSVTIEGWATLPEQPDAWVRLFDFGRGPEANMFLTPRNGSDADADLPRFAITTAGFQEEEQINAKEAFPTGKETHFAVTIDGDKHTGTLYINGKPVSTNKEMTLKPSDVGQTTLNHLGASQYESDALLKGTISEFRVYDTALTEAEVAASAKAGPDQMVEGAPTTTMAAAPATTPAAAPTPATAASTAKLVHRWSFAKDGSDSVGKANATLKDAKVADGKVTLDSETGAVDLPIGGTISKLKSITIEGWATWPARQGAWSRIFDFGTGPAVSMYLTPRHGRAEQGSAEDSLRFVITDAGFQEEEQINGPEAFPVGKETHFAVTIDADKHTGTLYINGKPVATNKELTHKPSDLGQTTNNWLGESQYETDLHFKGSISEFRIYDGALSDVAIAESAKQGPDAMATVAPAGGGAATSPPMNTSSTTPATAGVGAHGIVHRWSFDKDVADSVGKANGTLDEGATIADGRVVLDGKKAHVTLPIGDTIEKLKNASVETWVTWDERQSAWLRLFEFGARRGKSMYVTPRNGGGRRGAVRDTVRFTITVDGDPGEQQANSEAQFPVGKETHVVLTIDADKHVAKVYVDGKLIGTKEELTLSPSDLGKTTNNWLGQSQFPDPHFKGSFNEFRIYDVTLTPEEVAKDFELGPDKLATPKGN